MKNHIIQTVRIFALALISFSLLLACCAANSNLDDAVNLPQVIRIGAIGFADGTNPMLERFVWEFNKTHSEARAQIDYYENADQLRLDISSENAPDVLELSFFDIPYTDTLFSDLYPFLYDDQEYSSSILVESVLHSLEYKNKLLKLPSAFCVETVTARSRHFGKESFMSLDELFELKKSYDDYYIFPEWLTANEMMLWVNYVCLDQFVDWEHHVCDFENDAFISWLAFCKTCPTEYDPQNYSPDHNEHTLLIPRIIQNFVALEGVRDYYHTEPYVYIGFPNHNKINGSMFNQSDWDLCFAIPEWSSNKDLAWTFIRNSLSDAWQYELDGFPIKKSILERRLTSLTEKNNATLTPQDVNQFLELLDEITLFHHYDETLSNIILEEAIPFFLNQKDADEVAKLINNRATLYLQETFE